MNERQERLGEFVVARGDASELLDSAEETFDQVAVLVDMAIESSLIDSIGARRDDSLAALCSNGLDKGIRIVTLVRDDKFGRLILDQRFRPLDVGDLHCRENHAQGIAQGIDRHVQLGRQPAPRATDFLKAGFFWAPAECWWARTIVESMNMLHVGIAPQGRGHTRPNAFLAPTGEAYECSMPMPEFGREITPRATGTHDLENSLNETPIILGRAAWIACLAWQ